MSYTGPCDGYITRYVGEVLRLAEQTIARRGETDDVSIYINSACMDALKKEKSLKVIEETITMARGRECAVLVVSLHHHVAKIRLIEGALFHVRWYPVLAPEPAQANEPIQAAST